MTIIESYALDVSDAMHKAAAAHKLGKHEEALAYLEQAKRLHQEAYYAVWSAHHTSGTVA